MADASKLSPLDETLVAWCFSCRKSYSRFLLACPFCGSRKGIVDRKWIVEGFR